MQEINYSDFEKIELRVGTILSAKVSEKARKPAYKLQVDLGEVGVKRSSAQITKRYSPEELIGKQVIVVCNFPVKQVADTLSECLVLGVVGDAKDVVLLRPDEPVANGRRIA